MDEGGLDSLVDAVSDGRPIDWSSAHAGARDETERALIDQLRTVARVAPRAPMAPLGQSGPGGSGLLYRVVLALAFAKIVAALPGYVVRLRFTTDVIVTAPQALVLLTFGVTAAALLAGGRDRCSARLGALFLLVASAFGNGGIGALGAVRGLSLPVNVFRGITTDAFLAYALWAFVSVFPRPPERSRDLAISTAFLRLSLVVGVLFLVANTLLAFPAFTRTFQGWLWVPRIVDRASSGQSAYWPILFCVAAPALPYLLWRSRFEAIDERRWVATFAGCFVAGLSPMLCVVIVSPFIPFFDDPLNRRWFGLLLYASLLSLVPATVYAVRVQRVIDVHLVVRKGVQHRLARYGGQVVLVAPVLALVSYIYTHRHLSVAALASQREAVPLMFLLSVGIALMARHRVLRTIDRKFLREKPDHARSLASLERRLRATSGVYEVVAALQSEFDRAIHPILVTVLLHDEGGRALVPMDGAVPPLLTDAPLCLMLTAARQEIQVGPAGSGPVADLLPREDKDWLAGAGIELLVPLIGSSEHFVGAIAVGEKRSQLPFSPEDRALAIAMAGQAALTIENLTLRSMTEPQAREATRHNAAPIRWVDEPAALCDTCSALAPSSTHLCQRCGCPTRAAALPFVVEGKFELVRVLGAGGMGVVYLAVDIALDRRVAIKTLPRLTAERAMRLRREAQAMARVQHPNLALIFGMEQWRDKPLLIVEYLQGGTLADRLRRERLAPAEAMALGVVLADALDRLHASRLLHRDIKPSNIGYTAEGTPKLLDFGVASMVRDDGASTSGAQRTATDAAADQTVTSSEVLMGTLAYLSPEAAAGYPADSSVDLWSLSVVLYEAIAGVNPLAPATPAATADPLLRADVRDISQYRSECPESVAAFFRDALAASREPRPATAAELRNRCRRLLDELHPPSR